MDFLDEQIENLYESNGKKKAELNRKKQKLIKDMIYNDIGIPKSWVSKQDYKDTLSKLISRDVKLVDYLGLGNREGYDKHNWKQTRASTAKTTTRSDLSKDTMINSNSAVRFMSNHNNTNQSKNEDFIYDSSRSKLNIKKEFEKVCGDKYWEENDSYRKYNRPQTSRVEVYDRMKTARLHKVNGIDQKKIDMISEKIYKPLSAFPSLNSLKKTLACNNDEDLRKHFEANKPKEQFSLHKPPPKKLIMNSTKEVNQLHTKEVNKLYHEVNRMGPYYSHCMHCSKNNSEFYNNMDPENAISILKSIKHTLSVKRGLNS